MANRNHDCQGINTWIGVRHPFAFRVQSNAKINFQSFFVLITAQPAYPGVAGYEPDVVLARAYAIAIDRAMGEFRSLVPKAGSYVSESNFFEPN